MIRESGILFAGKKLLPRVNFKAGKYDTALEAKFKLRELRIAANMGSFPVVIKEALNMIGCNVGKCAEPIQPLTPEQYAKLEAVMKNIGLMK